MCNRARLDGNPDTTGGTRSDSVTSSPERCFGAVTPDEERWAEAGQILKWKGDRASAFVVERIAALDEAGDRDGVERFEAIRARLDALIHAARA